MDISIALRTVTPIFTLMGLGLLSRKINILKEGDERVLNSYVYFFALPSLFLVDLSETVFTIDSLGFIAAGILPILMILTILGIGYWLKAYSSNTFSLLAVAAIFGSTTFFGIPFVVFAFPTAEGLATLSAATIGVVSVPISIAILEFSSLERGTKYESFKRICGRFARNPLILSILVGFSLSLSGLRIPEPMSTSLHMIGLTTAPVAIFVLGVFLYGKKYVRVRWALVLSLLRIVILPAIAFLVATLLGLGGQEKATVVLMSSTPLALSTIVLSERYNFHKEMISSLLLVSSLAAGLYMNLWLYLV